MRDDRDGGVHRFPEEIRSRPTNGPTPSTVSTGLLPIMLKLDRADSRPGVLSVSLNA